MLLTAYLFILAGLGVFCLILHRHAAPPLALYMAGTAVLFACAILLLALSWITPGSFGSTTIQTSTPEGVYQDTYFVVVHTPDQLLILGAALFPLTLVWLQTRLRALYWPNLCRWLFWPIFLGFMVGPTLAASWMIWQMPQTYTGYEAHITRVSWAYTLCVVAGVLGLVALTVSFAIGLVRRFGLGHPPGS